MGQVNRLQDCLWLQMIVSDTKYLLSGLLAVLDKISTAIYLVIAVNTLWCSTIRGERIFSEDFESGVLGKNWEKYKDNPQLGGFETLTNYVHSGGKSYRISAPASTGEGVLIRGKYYNESDSWIRTWFLPGYDTVYIRWYAMFSENNKAGGMHWCQFWGSRPDNARSVLGGAGRRPDGTDRFIANVEPVTVDGKPPMGNIRFYTYWPDMKQSPDGFYWGNYFYPDEPQYILTGRWYCFEFMIKCNDPGKNNGEQALWIDGKEIMRIQEMRWRDIDELKLNMAMFGNYRGRAEYELTYWLDDVVISTEYVGLLEAKPQ